MVARDFERGSSEFIDCTIGALDFTGSTGNTFAAIVYFETAANTQTIIALATSTPAMRVRWGIDATAHMLETSNANAASAMTLSTATWYLLVTTRPGGSAQTVRHHRLDLAAGTWTHEDAASSNNDWTTPGSGGFVQLGHEAVSTRQFDGRCAIAAVWKRALTDAEVESLAGGFRAWLAQKPDGLWPLNQGAVATGVVDWTGGGANQSSITGTTIATEHVPRWRWGGTVRRVLRGPITAVTYEQAVGGTLTTAGGVVKQAGKPLAATLTTAGALVKLVAQGLVADLTTAGALTKQAATSYAGTLTSAGSLVRQANAQLAGTLTSVGAVVKQAAVALAGTLTSSGALAPVKVAVLAIAGTLTTAGSLTKQAAVGLAGTLTGAGSLTRLASRALAGTLSSAGTLVRQANAGLAGTLTTAGALGRQTGKVLAGTLTSDGGLTKLASRALEGTLASGGTVAKLAARSLAGALTTAGAIQRQANKALTGALTTAGGLATVASIAAAVAFLGSVAAVIRDGGTAALADAINGVSAATIREAGAASLVDATNGASSGTDRTSGATGVAGLPPQ